MEAKTRQRLEKLRPEELLELIDHLHGRDEAMDREIAVFASRQAPSAHVQKLRQWISSLENRHGFVSYRQSFDLAQEVEGLIGELEVLTMKGDDPVSALQLVESLLRAGGNILEGTDDSSGSVSTELGETAVLWLRSAHRCREAGQEEDWIGRVEQLIEDDEYGLIDDLLPRASILLSKPEQRELARRYEARASAGNGEDYGSSVAATKLGQLAWSLRDPSIYVRSIRLRSPQPNEMQIASIVECFLELGDPKGALEWLDEQWTRDEDRRLDLRAQAFAALGKEDDLIATRREIWERHPRVVTLENLLGLLSLAEQEELRADALDRAPTVSGLETALKLLFHLEKSAMAAEVLIHRRGELEGDRYIGLQSLVQQFEAADQPLASSLIYRGLLDSILRRGYSRAYHHAARYYSQLTKLAVNVTDWRGIEPHQTHIQNLRTQHGRKRSFWVRVGGAPK